MKLRRNVLQPLRLEIRSPVPFESRPLSQSVRYSSPIAERLRQFTESPDDSQSLRVDRRPFALLKEYSEHRQNSMAGHLFRTANRIQSTVDSVVVFSLGSAGLGARAFVKACCQPYWNHLSRADRGSKPRMFFLDDCSDNDTVQGLLHMLGVHRPSMSNLEFPPWALVVLATEEEITDSPLPEEAWQLEVLLGAIQKQLGNCDMAMGERLIAVVPSDSSIAARLNAAGDWDFFPAFPEGAALQSFGPLGLLPATLLGVNIMELLAGGEWMSRNFHEGSLGENLVLRFMEWLSREQEPPGPKNRFHLYNPGLEGWRRWYLQLRCASMASQPDASSGVETSEQGEIHVVVDRPRFDPIGLGKADDSHSRTQCQIDDRIRSESEPGRSLAKIRLGELDELHVGQWMQFTLLMMASCRVLGFCPPGMESSHLTTDHDLGWMA